MPEEVAKRRSGQSPEIPFLDALWETLKPFPGRAQLTLRLAFICTFIVLVADTFRLPFQDLLPFFILFVTKEEKVTTAVSTLLVLFAVTLAIAASILLFKLTGNRAEFRIPGIAVEIFVGMYLFRVLALGPVGWILGFVCAASQSLVYLSPDPEETVHQFLWLWVAIAFPVTLAWMANLLVFPVSARQLLKHEFVTGWRAIGDSSAQLIGGSPSAAESLGPLAKRGPMRLLKLLKLSLIESPDLREKEGQLRRMILSVDKITKLIFSYARARRQSSPPAPVAPAEAAILDELHKDAHSFRQQFEAGFVPSGAQTGSRKEGPDDGSALQLVEAGNTVADFAERGTEPENPPDKARAPSKPSMFVADAFTNPKHVQFALKVTLAGMIGYLFYTASDYYGIHTVFYTPLIVALASTGASIHKGLLRIVGCMVGGALAFVCSIWVIPGSETLGTFLFIVFCLHGLAAWIVFGGERISYIGLQMALAFDLGFLQDYGPPHNIDPLRDRFIGILLGLCILAAVFSLLWPESADSMARVRLAAGLRAIAQLLGLTASNDRSQSSIVQREQLELKIASSLSDANSYVEQAAFEAMLYGPDVVPVSRLAEAMSGVGEIYVATLPWIREQGGWPPTPPEAEERKEAAEVSKRLAGAMDGFADLLQGPVHRAASQEQLTNLLGSVDLAGQKLDLITLKELRRAMAEFSASIGDER
jgi:multidrug resistance protein MdtO